MDKNNPQDLYDWFMKTRMAEPRNCQELLDCVKAILAYMEEQCRTEDSSYNSNITFLRKKLILREDLAWSAEELDKIRIIIHWEIRSIETRRREQEKKEKECRERARKWYRENLKKMEECA